MTLPNPIDSAERRHGRRASPTSFGQRTTAAGTVQMLLLAALMALASLLTGCGNDPVVQIESWRLTAPEDDGNRVVVRDVRVPSHLDRLFAGKPTTYRLNTTVPLPVAMLGRTLTLAIPYMPALIDLRVHGVPLTPLDTPRAGDYRSSGPHRWRIPEEMNHGAAIDIELIIHHTWTQSAWFDSIPRLSATDQGDADFLRKQSFNEVTQVGGFATILLLSCSYWIIFLSGARRRVAPGWFALEALVGSVYPAFLLGITQPIFGVYDGAIMGMSLSVATFANVHFAHAHCRLPPPHRAWLFAMLASLTTYLLFARGPFTMTYIGAPTSVALMLTNAAYQTRLTYRLFRAGRPPLHIWIVPLAWPMAHAFAAADVAAWLGLGEITGGIRSGALGIGLIALQQSIALSREYILSLDRADGLNAELASRVSLLEAKNQEVVVLNTELRRQVASRSDTLAVAFSRLTGRANVHARPLAIGELVEDRYRVARCIGAGAMGIVYEVARILDGRQLALKVLSGNSGPSELARSAREAKIISEIHHPNVVSIVDVDVAQAGFFYLVMEYVDGLSLREHHRRFGDLPWALAVLEQMAEGLAAVHAHGVVHRDLKPANVLLAADRREGLPVVKIADFGISTDSTTSQTAGEARGPVVQASAPLPAARADEHADAAGASRLSGSREVARLGGGPSAPSVPPATGSSSYSLTETGMVLGTPKYMAPELVGEARLAQPSSDLFSFGVIAFELLTGRLPFDPPLAVAYMHGIALPETPSVARLLPTLDLVVATFIERCLSIGPDARPTAAEMAEVLRCARTGERGTSHPAQATVRPPRTARREP